MDDIERLTNRAIDKCMKRLRGRLLTKLRYWSSGGLSYDALRELDYPFAKRHGSPLLDPSIINFHEGETGVRDGWEVEIDGNELIVTNESDIYNDFLQPGTSKMFARGGIEDRAQGEIDAISNEILAEELEKVFGEN